VIQTDLFRQERKKHYKIEIITNLDYSRVEVAAAARKWPMKL
jgi:hypothetical protein